MVTGLARVTEFLRTCPEGLHRELRSCAAELSPDCPHVDLVAPYRRKELEKRMETLFQRIESAGHPPSPPTLQQEVDALRAFAQRWQSLPLEELCVEIDEWPHETARRMLKQAIWLAAGCDDASRSFMDCITEDRELLGRTFAPLYGLQGGTVWQQVEAEMLCNPEEAVARKRQFFQEQFQDGSVSTSRLKTLFKQLPAVLQQQLNESAYRFPFFCRTLQADLHKRLGAHYNIATGKTRFAVVAPNARAMVLNLTQDRRIVHSAVMDRGADGIWSIESSSAPPGSSYHFMVTGKEGGEAVKKVDPFAFQNVIHARKPLIGHPDRDGIEDDHESVVTDCNWDYAWTDSRWIASRPARHPAHYPTTIYEVHSPTWKKGPGGATYTWRDLAPVLGSYCRENGYNAVELMALFAHPQPISMGYQITNFFAPSSEMGTWQDLQFFVNAMHAQEISVFADWVPSHFAVDPFSLSEFDGSPLFEPDDPQHAYHPEWGTKAFDFKKPLACNFLTSNVDFLLQVGHFDALRVDAVASLLYMNYARSGFPRYNHKGTEVDLDAERFIQELNTFVHQKYPGVLMIAEESSGFPNLVQSVHEKGVYARYGLGFDLTWHMGFMQDSLEYWKKPIHERTQVAGEGLNPFDIFTNTMRNIDGGKYIRPRGSVVIPYSHDENANGKGTILGKMAGMTLEEKCADGRLALTYQLLRGGGAILEFMGNELLQSQEWHGRLIESLQDPNLRNQSTVQWESLDPTINPQYHHLHSGAAASRRDLNRLFLNSPGLWDQTDAGLDWFFTDATQGVLCFHRRGGEQQFACLFNTAGEDFTEYQIPLYPENDPKLARLSSVTEVYNTDASMYGGGGRVNTTVEIVRNESGVPTHLQLRLPPLTAILLQEHFST